MYMLRANLEYIHAFIYMHYIVITICSLKLVTLAELAAIAIVDNCSYNLSSISLNNYTVEYTMTHT